MKHKNTSFFVVIVTLVLAVFALLPWVFGMVAKQQYQHLLVLSEKDHIRVDAVHYHRGWLHSEVTFQIKLPAYIAPNQHVRPGKQDAQAGVAIRVHQVISHGPVFYVPNQDHAGTGTWHLGIALIKSTSVSPFGTYHVDTWIKFNGLILGMLKATDIAYMIMPSSSLREKSYRAWDVQHFHIHKLALTFTLSHDLDRIFAHARIDQIKVADSQTEEQFKDIAVHYNIQKGTGGLFFGLATYQVGAFTWHSDSYPVPLQLSQLHVQAYSADHRRTLQSLLDLQLGQLSINHKSYGPQKLYLVIHHVDIPALLQAKKAIRVLTQKGSQFTFSELLAQYKKIGLPLLRKGIRVDLQQLSLATPWGEPTLQLKMTLPSVPKAEDFAEIVQHATCEGEVRIPAILLTTVLEEFDHNQAVLPALQQDMRMTQQKITSWVMKKWLIPHKKGYYAHFVFRDKKLKLNGETVNVFNE